MSTQPAALSRSATSENDPALNDFGKLWEDALRRYKEKTGKDLLKLPFAKAFPTPPGSADEIVERLEKQNESFEVFRTSGKKILNVLRPIVDVVLLIKDCTEGASDAVPGGAVIFGVLGVLLQATKGVSRLYDAVQSLLDRVKNYLERVSIHLKPSTPPTPALLNVLVDTLVHIFTALALATKYCDSAVKGDSTLKRGARALRLRTKDYFREFVKKTGAQEVLNRLDALTDKERLVIAASSYAVVRDTHAVVQEVQPQVKFVYDEAVVNSFRSWLHPPNEQALNHERKSEPGSCQWFFDEEFVQWKAQKNGVYWVYGNAGAGKSILCSSVVDSFKEDPALTLAYFYFDYSDTAKQNSPCQALVSSLVFQLATCFENCKAYLREKQFARSPTYDELIGLLSGLLGLSGRTFIVIDALDECPEHARGRAGLVRLFKHLRSLQNRDDIDLRVLVTSRPELDIKACMSPLATHTLNINIARAHTDDIRNYLSTQLFNQESDSFSHWDVNVKWRVCNTLNERSNGMFLWVVLQLHDMKDCVPTDVDRALYELPSNLDETYERILKNFSSKPTMVTRARHLFECVAFAVGLPRLSAAAVAEILSIDFDSALPYVASTSDIHISTSRDPETTILHACPRLLEIVSGDEGHKTVQFIHRSVQEYLTSATLQQATSSPAYPYSFNKSSAQLTLAKICLSVLVVDGPVSDLQKYADGYWYYYVSSRNEDALGELLDSFFHMRSPSFARWEGRTHHQINTPFHWVAWLGLYCRVEGMLERSGHDLSTLGDSLVRARSGYEVTALMQAAAREHVDVCRLLLEHGALVEDTDSNGFTPLHYAARNGHLDIIRLLLEHPASDGSDAAALRCRIRSKNGQTVLHIAASRGHADVCRLLLEHGALVEDTDIYGSTPLHYAASNGHLDIIRLLLEHPASDGSNAAALRCRIRRKGGQTALHIAASMGHADVCRLLLEHGALVGDVNNYGKTPLQCAQEQERSDVVQVLSEHIATAGSAT